MIADTIFSLQSEQSIIFKSEIWATTSKISTIQNPTPNLSDFFVECLKNKSEIYWYLITKFLGICHFGLSRRNAGRYIGYKKSAGWEIQIKLKYSKRPIKGIRRVRTSEKVFYSWIFFSEDFFVNRMLERMTDDKADFFLPVFIKKNIFGENLLIG